MGVCVCVFTGLCVCIVYGHVCVYFHVYVYGSDCFRVCFHIYVYGHVCVSMCMFMGIYAAYNCSICISAESGMQIDLTTHPINTQATQFGPNNMVPYLTGIMYGIHRILKWVKIVSSI